MQRMCSIGVRRGKEVITKLEDPVAPISDLVNPSQVAVSSLKTIAVFWSQCLLIWLTSQHGYEVLQTIFCASGRLVRRV